MTMAFVSHFIYVSKLIWTYIRHRQNHIKFPTYYVVPLQEFILITFNQLTGDTSAIATHSLCIRNTENLPTSLDNCGNEMKVSFRILMPRITIQRS